MIYIFHKSVHPLDVCMLRYIETIYHLISASLWALRHEILVITKEIKKIYDPCKL